ncbi:MULTISPECIES: DNA repair exonuclease [unclassified Methanoregula]|uniref:metallophosphoesterase family protein n=1 Tax=unclassified Methanoregula TaxID=2649730 RepID=UPI0009C59917|nr:MULTISPECIES: DNA repair exonuclease [unclassified Methanoregula]OPX65359.1 MAG: DNA double-strand break repair protein Mre11 [Methanoregula sp. PtaB.Bin085]OPY32268.1 MAG: DNA double-strand break repair protein Mre11 [Methanoregula sp. PtaU1.Bin006]
MKLIHIADTHLGLAAFSRLDPETGMNLREKQIYDNFLRGINDIINQKPDALVHAGDLFDTVKPKTKAYTTVLEALERLRAADIPLIIIAGNHSMTKTRYTTSPYEVLTYHPGKITAAYKFRYEKAEIGDTVFHLLPNMLRPEDYRTEFDKIELSKSRHNVLVTHGLATQIKDKRLATVAEHELDGTILGENFDYIALGHYHRQCQITDNAWYSGSQEFLTYGEIKDEKGGLIVDTAKRTVTPMVLPHTPMADCGTIKCAGMHPGDITEEIISRVSAKHLPLGAMAQITLDQLCREDGKGIDMKQLAGIREGLLDLKIRVRAAEEDTVQPLQQDIRMIDYLQEFSSFIDRQGQLTAKQKAFIAARGREILVQVMEEHRGEVE